MMAFLLAPIASTANSQDQPTIAKDSIQIRAFTFNVYKGNYDVWSWVPEMKFRVNGPIASGSQLYVERRDLQRYHKATKKVMPQKGT